jgi:hypothetical protein
MYYKLFKYILILNLSIVQAKIKLFSYNFLSMRAMD